MLHGFDVSTWNPVGHYPGQCSFAFARSTYGQYHDAHYAEHYTALRHAGLVVGAYHFGVGGAQTPVAVQAQRFLEVAGNADILALDLETNRGGATMTEAEADAFCRAVQRGGRRLGLYHSRSGFPSASAVHFNFRWVAQWGIAPPAITWTFWQSSGIGIDRDYFRGDAAALAALVKASHV